MWMQILHIEMRKSLEGLIERIKERPQALLLYSGGVRNTI